MPLGFKSFTFVLIYLPGHCSWMTLGTGLSAALLAEVLWLFGELQENLCVWRHSDPHSDKSSKNTMMNSSSAVCTVPLK